MIVIRKLKTAAFLLSHWTTRALLRVRNLLRKRARHYGKRAVWAWKDLSERAKNARIAARNLSHKAVDRVLNLRKPFIRFARRRKRAAQLHDQVREEQKVEARALKLAGSGQPIILGPWISEVGFEVLYWIPFLAWLRAERGWDASRVAAVSRGGVRSWYSGLADHYVEIFDCFSPDEFAARNASRREATEGTHKQLEVSDLDQELVAFACDQTGFERPALIHPSFMYRQFRHFWLDHRAISHVEERTRFSRRQGPAGPDLPGLPSDYVAVKAYTAQSLPDIPRNRQVLRAMIEHLAETTNVVTLDTGLVIDDHEDFRLDQHPRVFNLSGLLTPQNNLEVQTQVIARARAFVGTCGSLTWLAPMLGVPTVALLSDSRYLRAHLHFARHAYHAMGAASFATVDVNAVDHMGLDLTMAVRRSGRL